MTKPTPEVNFTNISRAALAPKSINKKLQNLNCNHIKDLKKLSYKKNSSKMLMIMSIDT